MTFSEGLTRFGPVIETRSLEGRWEAIPDLGERLEALPDLEERLEGLPVLRERIAALPDLEEKLRILPDLEDRLEGLPNLGGRLDGDWEGLPDLGGRLDGDWEGLPDLRAGLEETGVDSDAGGSPAQSPRIRSKQTLSIVPESCPDYKLAANHRKMSFDSDCSRESSKHLNLLCKSTVSEQLDNEQRDRDSEQLESQVSYFEQKAMQQRADRTCPVGPCPGQAAAPFQDQQRTGHQRKKLKTKQERTEAELLKSEDIFTKITFDFCSTVTSSTPCSSLETINNTADNANKSRRDVVSSVVQETHLNSDKLQFISKVFFSSVDSTGHSSMDKNWKVLQEDFWMKELRDSCEYECMNILQSKPIRCLEDDACLLEDSDFKIGVDEFDSPSTMSLVLLENLLISRVIRNLPGFKYRT